MLKVCVAPTRSWPVRPLADSLSALRQVLAAGENEYRELTDLFLELANLV